MKNGTLGTVVEIEGGASGSGHTPGQGERLTVRLDDGRAVSLDVKDYGHVDHGYAATVHKSQGVTVDREYVLASRPMDRHAAYVGLTRHREQVALHWRADELGSREGLVRVLGRERLKDTNLDHGSAETEHARGGAAAEQAGAARQAASNAERWGLVPESEIVLRERDASAARDTPAQRRSVFAGLELQAGATAGTGAGSEPEREQQADAARAERARPRSMFASLKLPAGPAEGTGVRAAPEREREVERLAGSARAYARAWADAERMREAGEEDAVRAFEALRVEVAALRRGIELVYRQGQEAPAVDYSPTLGEMAKTLQAVQGRLAAIEGKPALGLTPQLFREVMEDAGQRAGERAGRAMADGAAAQSAAPRELQSLVGRAHTRKDQREWLDVAAACGVMLGVVLMYLLAGMLPWGGGDWLAASLVGGEPCQAGQTLMQDADLQSFDKMVTPYNVCGTRSVEFCTAAIILDEAATAGKGSGAETT